MKQRIYIDTSVFGGYFDEEFKEHTIPLFDRIKEGEFLMSFLPVQETDGTSLTWTTEFESDKLCCNTATSSTEKCHNLNFAMAPCKLCLDLMAYLRQHHKFWKGPFSKMLTRNAIQAWSN